MTVDWSQVKWGRSDEMIAAALGVSRERVRQVRNALGIGAGGRWPDGKAVQC